ncbi:MAG: helix-turn-helix transcriptional regulator [Oscillospiraceae bacterium]|nr:helix-turn-helix transcriptional regulator [Oscillospiraceae bacterium]
MTNTLGQNILRFREQAGLSQGELGNRVGVSAQAVSRWERGGMPDAALLPQVAIALGRSLDELFSLQPVRTQSLEGYISQELNRTPPDQLMARTFQLAWHLMKAHGSICSDVSERVFANTCASEEAGEAPANCYFDLNGGLMQAAVTSHCKYALFMPEPREGFSSMLKSTSDYQQLFALLGKEYRLATLLLGYTLPRSQQFNADYVCAELGISPELAREILDELFGYNMLDHRTIQVPGCRMDCYRVFQNPDIVPLLYFAGNFMRDRNSYNVFLALREGPLLSRPLPAQATWAPAADSVARRNADLQYRRSDASFD